MNSFAKNLKYIIARFGMNQTDIALHVNKKQTTVSNWIRGLSEPDVSDLLSFYQLFGISIDTLIATDMEKDGAITDDDVNLFRQTGKLQGRIRRNTGSKAGKEYPPHNGPSTSISEAGFGLEAWAIMGQLRILQDKIDIIIHKITPPADDTAVTES